MASIRVNSLPSSMTINLDHRVAICVEHGSSYVRRKQLDRHLYEQHHINAKTRRDILAQIDDGIIAETVADVVRPVDGVSPIPELVTYNA
jgi:hypothetical protein